ncbi:HET-domain-containing protein [Trematosphaeria pertusa]|uniref:HET-domain-containing protein n=1 Tax=Trematosphaeria pertusa TaxID=390896 RepID=A0A6A6I7D4_9PLEO|nr:HET-domain-containing protein [Trematosphaeria pertusa]KAF2245420.1 HET-domain-containing protein [Trematosphaeria pertusa]
MSPKRGGHSTPSALRDLSPPNGNGSIYESLPEVEYLRVLKLHPGAHNDEIKCHLEIVSPECSKDQYEAISYVWGDPNITTEITCNRKHVPVTVNLVDALRTFRDSDKMRTLWADALCINQKDDREKGHQVKRMGHVFENAKCVLVWLGRDTGNVAEDCFELIRDTTDYFDKMFLQNDREVRRIPALTRPYPICVDEERWRNVRTLLSLPWFHRVWIIQEAAVAKECIMFWGAAKIDIADAFELSCWYLQKADFAAIIESFSFRPRLGYLGSDFRRIHSKYNTQQSWRYSRPLLKHHCLNTDEWNFVSLLRGAQGMNASDPRDRVYAFLGCPYAKQKDGQTIIEADYSKTTEEFYLHTACTLLQHQREGPWVLTAIYHPSLDHLLHSKRPSWVPNWSQAWHQYRIANPANWYRAGGRGELFSASPREDNVLEVAGFVFDKIAWTSTLIQSHNITLTPHTWDEEIHVVGEPYIDILWKETSSAAAELGMPLRHDDYTLTLVSGYSNRNSKTPDMTLHRANFKAYRCVARSLFSNASDVGTKPATGDGDLYRMQAKITGCKMRRLALTEGGRLGLVPGLTTEVGDVCCIFIGVSVPLILKPANNGRYRLGGDGYISGVMDGELMEQYDSGGFGQEKIVLI